MRIVGSFAMTSFNLAWSKATEQDWTIFIKEHPTLDSWFCRNIPYRYSGVCRCLKETLNTVPEQYVLYMNDAAARETYAAIKATCRWLRNIPWFMRGGGASRPDKSDSAEPSSFPMRTGEHASMLL